MRKQEQKEIQKRAFSKSFMQRIINQQEKLKAIWEDAERTSPPRQRFVFSKRNEATDSVEVTERSFFRRGYKVSHTTQTGLYELLRTNTSDYYKHATNAEIELFNKKGWIVGCDTQQIARNRASLKTYNRKIDNANKERNDSLITHWRRRRMELINNISSIEESLNKSNGITDD